MEELLMVKGIDKELFDSLAPFITVYGDSSVNVFTAPGEVLAAIGLPDELVRKIVAAQTDEPFLSRVSDAEAFGIDAFLQLLKDQAGLKHEEQVMLRSYLNMGRLKFNSNVFRIRSEGVVPMSTEAGGIGDPTITAIEVVYERSPSGSGDGGSDFGSGNYLYWREE